jgi:hypothetical protein
VQLGAVAILPGAQTVRRLALSSAAAPGARKVSGWPKIYKLAHVFLLEHSYKRLELALSCWANSWRLAHSPGWNTRRSWFPRAFSIGT